MRFTVTSVLDVMDYASIMTYGNIVSSRLSMVKVSYPLHQINRVLGQDLPKVGVLTLIIFLREENSGMCPDGFVE